MRIEMPLHVNRVEVRRMPGFPAGFTLTDLCEGINIIYGPNASGKSTTAQTIQALLWPGIAPNRAAFRGQLRLAGSDWLVEYDAGHSRVQRDGSDLDRLDIAPPETRDRYILTLHDLLSADNASFAEDILRESAGGYDTGAALQQLDYREKTSRPTKEINRVKSATQAVQDARKAQRALRKEESDLHALRIQRETANEARSHAELLRAAIKYAQARHALDDAQRMVKPFPDQISKLTGHEAEDLDKLRMRLLNAHQQRIAAEATIRTGNGMLAATGLSDTEITEGAIRALWEQARRLQDLSHQIDGRTQDIEGAKRERDAARARIVHDLSEERLSRLDTAGLRQVVDSTRRYEALVAERAAQDTLASWWGSVKPPGELVQLREGISLLNRLLRLSSAEEIAGESRSQGGIWVVLALAIGQTVLLAVLVHPVFLVLAVVAIVIVFARRKPQPSTMEQQAAYLRQEYQKLGIDQPIRWTADEMEKLADQLADRFRQAVIDDEKATRWASLQSDRDRVEQLRLAAEAEQACLQEAFGLHPIVDSASLALLANSLANWQSADGRVQEAAGKRAATMVQHREQLDAINTSLSRFGYPAVASDDAARGYIEDLAARYQNFVQAQNAVRTAQASLNDSILPEIERIETERRTIFDRLGLADDDEVTLRHWLNRLPDYQDAMKALEQARFTFDSTAASLEPHPDLKDQPIELLAVSLREAEEQASRYDAVNELIIQIETRINQAKHERNLEVGLADEQESLNALREARERDYRTVTGWTLGAFIRQRTRDHDRPRVFHRAREIFSRITQGRYRLEFEEHPSPTFRASDMTTGVGHGLNELSSATRLQLLIAVRVAFVEEMETGPKLPILLDETLGNSDEQRARAIIDAMIEICRDGRQVFYFTAQTDEVGKWVGMLKGYPAVPYKTVNLTEARGLAEFEQHPPLEIVAPPSSLVPAPNGMTRLEYGRMLRVSGINCWIRDIGGIHLWYLISDLDLLHQLISIGITTWGQLRNLRELGGQALFDGRQQALLQADARANLLRVILEAWRIGRGRPVDRLVIIDSGAVSDIFINDVSALAEHVDRDASRLIAALEQKKVPNFRTKSITLLRTYLQQHGYLSAGEPLGSDEVRIRALAAAGDDIAAGHISAGEIDELMALLGLHPRHDGDMFAVEYGRLA